MRLVQIQTQNLLQNFSGQELGNQTLKTSLTIQGHIDYTNLDEPCADCVSYM